MMTKKKYLMIMNLNWNCDEHEYLKMVGKSSNGRYFLCLIDDFNLSICDITCGNELMNSVVIKSILL